MLVVEGESANASGTAGSSQHSPPPPPPPPSRTAEAASPARVAAAEVKSAETQYRQASSWLAELKKARANVAASSPSPSEKDLVGLTSRSISLGDIDGEIATAQAKLGADERSIKTAEANLAAARGAEATANRYRPAPPPVTASTPVTRALAPLVATAKREQEAAAGRVAQDRAALHATNAAFHNSIPNGVTIPANFALARVRGLEQARAQQEHQLDSDQRSLDAANATLASANVMNYGQQVSADRAAVSASRNALVRMGVLGSNGKFKNLAELNPEQTGAFYRYADAKAKLNVDSAMRTQSARQLAVYASEPAKYGTIAADAVGGVNQALASAGMHLSMPAATKPEKAEAALAQANNTLAGAAAKWGVTSAAVRYFEAGNRLTTLEREGTGAAKGQLAGAQIALMQAQAELGQASTYAQKLAAGQASQADQNALAAAEAKYHASPGASTARLLDTARARAAQSQWQSHMAEANFLAALGQVYAARQSAPMLAAQQRVADLQQQVTAEERKQSACLSSSSPLQIELARAEVTLTQATSQAAPAQVTAQYLNANASLVAANDAQATAQGPAARNNASIQQALAHYQLNLARFRLSLPSNLLNPQSASDQAAYNAKLNDSFAAQKGTLSDPAVASQLAGLAPGQKVDVQSGISEIRADLKAEQKIESDRSLMQEGWDWVSGQSSGTASYLQGELGALTSLQKNGDGMSAASFNERYLQIMGNLSTRFGTMSAADMADEQNWSNAEEAVVDTASMVAAMAGAAATGGALGILVGAAAGMVVDQGGNLAQNGATVAQGGNLSSDPGISLFTPLTDNFGEGNVTNAERAEAETQAESNAILSLTAAASVGAGAFVRGATEAAIEPTLGTGTAARAVSGMAGMTATQGGLGLGQVAAAIPQGSGAVKTALKGAGVSLVTAPFLGLGDGVSEAALEGLASRTAAGAAAARTTLNLGTNLALTAGANAADGQGFSASDWSSAIVNSIAPEAMDHIVGTPETGSDAPEETGPFREPGEPTASLGAAYHPERPGLSPETEAMLGEAAANFDPQRPTPLDPSTVSGALGRYYRNIFEKAARAGEFPPNLGPEWIPSSTDDTLIVGGIGQRSGGEVSLNVYPGSWPNILSDIRHNPIPDEHFGSVVFERFDYPVLTETPPLALREAYRVLKPGGSLRITTSREALVGGDERTTIVQHLRALGFTDVEANWLPDARDPYTQSPTQFFEFKASKPSDGGMAGPLFPPGEVTGAAVTDPDILRAYPPRSVKSVSGSVNASVLLGSPSEFIDQLKSALKPGGTVALKTGSLAFEQRDGLQRQLGQAGFTDVSIRFVGPSGHEIPYEPEAGWAEVTARMS